MRGLATLFAILARTIAVLTRPVGSSGFDIAAWRAGAFIVIDALGCGFAVLVDGVEVWHSGHSNLSVFSRDAGTAQLRLPKRMFDHQLPICPRVNPWIGFYGQPWP